MTILFQRAIKALSKQYPAVVSMTEGKVLPYFVLSRNYNEQSRDFELFIGSVIEKVDLESCVLSANEYAKITVIIIMVLFISGIYMKTVQLGSCTVFIYNINFRQTV